MSLPRTEIDQIPPETGRVARAIFPQGNQYMRLHEVLATVYEAEHFADLFSHTGQSGESPVRLALVSILQFAEGLTDRQAADAVRTRIDWKYRLGLELEDRGFHHSILSEFCSRLLTGNVEHRLWDCLLDLCWEQGWLKVRGQQRTDSTHLLGAIRALNRLECVGETFHHTLKVLAVTVPDWLLTHSDPAWIDRYGPRVDDYHLPKSQAERVAYAERIGQDGQALLTAIDESETHRWLRELPVVQTLSRVWQQNYRRQAGQLQWRTAEELPKAVYFVSSPYDLDARYSQKRGVSWISYKVHLTEICDPEQPHLITHVETTSAPVSDDSITPRVHAALQTKALLSTVHLVDTGYIKAEYLVSSREGYGVDLLGPTRANYQWQARSQTGFGATHLTIDWVAQQVACPAGNTGISWSPTVDQHHNRSSFPPLIAWLVLFVLNVPVPSGAPSRSTLCSACRC